MRIRSHGPIAEPNLTPLLDIVLQLIMFFMICVSFLSRDSDFGIRLPVMAHASPPDPTGLRLVLNLDAQGALHLAGEYPLSRDADILGGLTRIAGRCGQPADQLLVIIRADARVEYGALYHLMSLCRQAGLNRFQLRAESNS